MAPVFRGAYGGNGVRLFSAGRTARLAEGMWRCQQSAALAGRRGGGKQRTAYCGPGCRGGRWQAILQVGARRQSDDGLFRGRQDEYAKQPGLWAISARISV